MQNFATFSKNQLDSFVDLEKPEKMRIWSQNFVSIQPRTSLEKSDVSWPTAQYLGSVSILPTYVRPSIVLCLSHFLISFRYIGLSFQNIGGFILSIV